MDRNVHVVPFQFCCINRTRYILHASHRGPCVPKAVYTQLKHELKPYTARYTVHAHYTAIVHFPIHYTAIHYTTYATPLSLVKTRRIDLHVPRNGSGAGSRHGLAFESSLGYGRSRIPAMASSQGGVRPSPMAYPAVRPLPKLPLPLRPETRTTA